MNTGRDKIQSLLLKKEANVQASVQTMLKGKYLSITSDGWTSCANESYTALTSHFIHDWKLVTVCILVFMFLFYTVIKSL